MVYFERRVRGDLRPNVSNRDDDEKMIFSCELQKEQEIPASSPSFHPMMFSFLSPPPPSTPHSLPGLILLHMNSSREEYHS